MDAPRNQAMPAEMPVYRDPVGIWWQILGTLE